MKHNLFLFAITVFEVVVYGQHPNNLDFGKPITLFYIIEKNTTSNFFSNKKILSFN
jgi:hypothetical protein